MCIHPMTVSNSMRQKLIELQGEINESTVTVEELKSSTTLHQNWTDQAGGKSVRIELTITVP